MFKHIQEASATRRKNILSYGVGVAFIVVIWAISHCYSLNWGLPNPRSFAFDAVAMTPNRSAKDFMSADAYRYPPLQYLIWDTVKPAKPVKKLAFSEFVQQSGDRLLVFRQVVACMTLGTALLLFLVSQNWLSMGHWSFIPPLIFLLNPTSLFYSHATNMDQPYLFWLTLSWVIFLYSTRKNKKDRPLVFGFCHAIFGVTMGAAFCTKDPVFAYYILPIFLFISTTVVKEKKLRKSIFLLLVWICSFAIITTVIYASVGGWGVFHSHFQWITGPGSKDWVQFGSEIGPRVELLIKSLKDLAEALDWPLLGSIGVFALVLNRRLLQDPKLRTILLFGLIEIISFQLFFVQVTRFSYPRFYLPLVAVFSLVAGKILLNIFHKRLFLWGYVLFFVAVISLIGLQVVRTLTEDTRMALKRYLLADGEHPPRNTSIGLDASSYGHSYYSLEGQIKKTRVIRDWSLSTFGVLSKYQKSLIVAPLYLGLLRPHVVILAKENEGKRQLLRKFGYTCVQTVHPPKGIIRSWFSSYICPTLYLFQNTQKTLPIKKEDVTLSFEDQLLVLQDCHHPSIEKEILLNFGRLCQDFSPPDLMNFGIEPKTIEWAAKAYFLNKRKNSFYKAAYFLASRLHHPKYQELLEPNFSGKKELK